MMKRMKRLFGKLRGRKGESIAEALVGLMIAALALVLLASMIGTSARMILKSEDDMDEYVSGQNALNSRTGGTGATVTLTVTSPVPAALTDKGSDSIPVDRYQINVGGETVTAYAAKGVTTP